VGSVTAAMLPAAIFRKSRRLFSISISPFLPFELTDTTFACASQPDFLFTFSGNADNNRRNERYVPGYRGEFR